MKNVLIILIVIFGIGFGIYSFTFYDLTSNCPWKYRFESETGCFLRDKRGNTELMEFFNPSQDTLWLAKSDGKNLIWLEHPINHVSTYKPHIPDNEVKFSDDSLQTILVNGVSYTPKELPDRPPPDGNKVPTQ